MLRKLFKRESDTNTDFDQFHAFLPFSSQSHLTEPQQLKLWYVEFYSLGIIRLRHSMRLSRATVCGYRMLVALRLRQWLHEIH